MFSKDIQKREEIKNKTGKKKRKMVREMGYKKEESKKGRKVREMQ